MAQHDYVISNASGSAVRSDLNNALSAIATQNSGSSEPTTTYAYMKWADTTAGVMKMRNGANNAWIALHQLDGEYSTIPLENGTAGAPSLYFKDSGIDTGVYSPGTDQVGIATAGVERVEYGTSEVVFNDGGVDYDLRVEGDTKANLFFVDASADAVSVDGAFSVTGNATVGSLNSGPLAGSRNRIINGGMDVTQRSGGAAVAFTAGAALGYPIDRWYGYCTGADVTGQQIPGSILSPGALSYSSAYRITGASGCTSIGLGQRIESLNSYDLAGTTATLSVSLANSLLTTVTWTAYYANTLDSFGTLASPTRTQIATGTFTVNSTVTRYSTNISVPAAASTGIEIVFTVGAQTSGTWTITNVQLEAGTVATPFERRSYGQELALCQRYFQWAPYNINFLATAPAQALETSVMWAVPMRASPTAAVLTPDPNTAQAAANNGSNVFQRLTPYGGSASAQSISATNIYVVGYRSGLSAEL